MKKGMLPILAVALLSGCESFMMKCMRNNYQNWDYCQRAAEIKEMEDARAWQVFGQAMSNVRMPQYEAPAYVPPPIFHVPQRYGVHEQGEEQEQGGGSGVCNCHGYNGPGGPCYAGPGGAAYAGPGGPAYAGIGGPCYAGIGGAQYDGIGGPEYKGIGGPAYDGIGGPRYDGIGGPAYDGIGGPCYAGIGGPCYAGIGGTGNNCPSFCK